jgi:hypothetical protein
MAAIKNFVFYPALVDDEKVDSIINYRMTFDLVD